MSKSKTPEAPKPMDMSAPEADAPVVATNNQRTCKAIKTLVAEVLHLFPETPYEVSNYNGRNTGLDVTFDLTTLDSQDRTDLISLLWVAEVDPRVATVDAEDGMVLVSMQASPRVHDGIGSFGLNDAYLILVDGADGSYGEGSL